ncbi:glycosyltransferase family 2 protein [Filimonas effusa]|uniref:Glycosyltransferase n=1 Tax=Filimonas effusa TaxID=2508721 RepID=A0A4Q1D5K3_9BACT|nr:glycosyltransferase [Filimonas effusa]RXK83739.1 glycosyltransferase [Filimonas effusa]
MKPEVSVVVATWQRPQLLEKCLQALLRQRLAAGRYQVIIVTDGLDEASCRLVRQYRDRGHTQLYCYSLPVKRGPAAARNLGWQMAEAPLVVFTDDDCIPDPGFLGAYINAYKAYGVARIAFTGKVTVPVSPVPTDYEQNVAQLSSADFITANCACSRTALVQAGGFDEAFETAWREDSDLEFKFIDNGIPVYKVEDARVIHPVRPASWGVSLKEQRKSLYNALLYKKYPSLYRKKISRGPQWRYYGILFCLLLLVVLAFGHLYTASLVALGGWAFLTAGFIYKRLRTTSRNFSHVMEMICTSLLIPFLSIYWTIYGAVRYKVLFL